MSKVNSIPSSRAKAVSLSNTAYSNARGLKAIPASSTEEDKKKMLDVYMAACHESLERMSVDHIYPLGGQRYGVSGLHVPSNLVVIPLSENGAKNNRPHESWENYSNPEWTKDDVRLCLSLHRKTLREGRAILIKHLEYKIRRYNVCGC